ncbi:MAG: NlpC/P60 family protein [Coriobacteriales bacterium]|nr:NlpC/P60 family protein [Coriobacteriales bacterium]
MLSKTSFGPVVRRIVASAAALAVVVSTMGVAPSAQAVTAAEKKAEVQSVQSKISTLNDELEGAVESYNSAQIAYENATQKVDEAQAKIDETQKKIEGLQARIETRAKAMYRSGSMSYMEVVLGSGSFDEFATTWDTLNHLNADDANLVETTKQSKAELEQAKAELDEQKTNAEDALSSAASYKQQIESKQAEYNNLYNSLSSEYKTLLAQEQEAAARAQAAAAAAYTPAATTKSTSSSSSSSSSSSKSQAASAPASSGGGDAVSRARSTLGLPYVWGGVGPNGYDCSGLVGYALTGSHKRRWVASDFWAMPAVSNPQPGDVVACSNHHCGLYIGNGQMIEAPHTGAVIRISAVRGKIVRVG